MTCRHDTFACQTCRAERARAKGEGPDRRTCPFLARVVDTGAMLVFRPRASALAVALSLGACLSDEGPLFEPVPPSVEVAPPLPEPAELPATPAAASGTTIERPTTQPALVPTAATDEVGDGSDTPEPAPASAICDVDGVIACDTFEEQPLGAFPSGSAWLPELSGCGTHRVDDAGPAASGVRALLASDGGYPECMLHAAVGAEDEIYVRTSVFLGADGDLLSQYVSLIELGVSADRDDPELRIGLRPAAGGPCDGTPGLDFTASGLVGGTSTDCSGVPLETERWHCLEVHLSRAGQQASVSLSVDGAAVLARDVVGGSGWAEPSLFVKLGRAAYGQSSQGSLWHDDVVVSRQPIPCEPLAAGAP